jgi:hypothetical protein
MDFTLKTYKRLIQTFMDKGYKCLTYESYCVNKEEFDISLGKFVILRHDVDEFAGNALKMAEIEHSLGVRSTYYFRVVKQSNRPEIIREIVKLGHEIGYHYEDLAFAKGNLEHARKTFEENLTYFRTFYPVKTVCMHGSSISEFDNRSFWKNYNLSDFGLVGEPYVTTDFIKVFYLTDTGLAWDARKFRVWDNVMNTFNISYHSSNEVIKAIKQGSFPEKCLMLAHTLWSDNLLQWSLLHMREFLRNNLKYMAQRNKILNRIYTKMVITYWGLPKK